jgi:hypothetical protein
MANDVRAIEDKAQTITATPHWRGVSGTGRSGSDRMTSASHRPIDQILEVKCPKKRLNRSGTPLRLEDTCRRRRIAGELACRTPWARYEFTATVRALAFQPLLGAAEAEGAFERTNPGLARLRGEVDVAALAAGSEF